MNVVTILCDTLRADHCGPYHQGRSLRGAGCPQQPDWVVATPNLDKLAARSTVFDNAWSGSTPCMPARRDLYTGRYEFLHRGWGPLEDDDADLPREVSGPPNRSVTLMQREGRPISHLVSDHFHLWEQGGENYHTGYTGFEFIRGAEADAWHTDPIEFDCPPADRLEKTERHYRNVHLIGRDPEQAFPARVFRAAADWLRRNHRHERFYLHIDCFSPHEPWDPPEELVRRFDPRGYLDRVRGRVPYGPWRDRYSEDELLNIQARYAAQVVLTDQWLGTLIDALDGLDLWQNTLVVLTTDHGTFNGDHDRLGKIQTHDFPGVSRLPMVIHHPTAAHGERRSQLVQLVDLYPTTLAALGLPVPESRLDGVNLLPLFDDRRASTREVALGGMFGKSLMATDGRWMLHQSPRPDNEPLYWYGLRDSRFPPVECELGPYRQGRRAVGGVESWREPAWLSDLETDPAGLRNVASDRPEELGRMRERAAAALLAAEAPPEQFIRLGLA